MIGMLMKIEVYFRKDQKAICGTTKTTPIITGKAFGSEGISLHENNAISIICQLFHNLSDETDENRVLFSNV